MKELVIVGAGGFGREVLEWADGMAACGRDWTIKGYLDDFPADRLKGTISVPVLGTPDQYEPQDGDIFVCAVGNPRMRKRLQSLLTARGAVFVSLVHPTAIVCKTAVLGHGVIVCPYALVSADATVGDGSVVYYHSSVDHDARVESWVQISGHCDIAGAAKIGAEVFLGSHSVVLPGVTVGGGAIVGAGAIVAEDVAAGNTVVGVPARIAVRNRITGPSDS
jgi:sugar O-acyltransferase (sialic acid O-acetyltransferase NeuD family)